MTMQSPVKTLSEGLKPSFEENLPASLVISESEILEIKASYGGKPKPSVKWYRNGIEINKDNKRVSIVSKDGVSTLVIRNTKAGLDDGLYSCHIKNEDGYAIEETAVTVISTEVSYLPYDKPHC